MGGSPVPAAPDQGMLSRNAQGLYWMSRYLERAAHGCRLLADQIESLEDRPVEEIDRGWRRIYAGLNREPTAGGLESSSGDEGIMLADAYTLADDLTFEAQNHDSIRACIDAARENARQVRNAIGEEMWSSLNATYLGLRDMGIAEVWSGRPREFYLRTEDAIRTFNGIAESTMYRDHGWHFLRLGRFVERMQLVAALVETQLSLFPTGDPHAESDWGTLLRVCDARAAYQRLYSLDYHPAGVVDFLVSDPRLSHSIRHALARVSEALQEVVARREHPSALEATRRVGRMAAEIDYDWPERDRRDDAATRATLAEFRNTGRLVHVNVERACFDYAIEEGPGS